MNGVWRIAAVSLILGLLGVYIASGAWPLVPLFGDGIAIANGAEEINRSGLGPNPLTRYYSQHPGAHVAVAAVSAATGMSTTTSLLALCALASFVSILCVAALVRRWISCSYVIALVSVLLFQESYSAAYYGNSTVLASAFAFGGLLALSRRNSVSADVLAGVLFATACYMRLDAVLIVPAGIVLILQGDRSSILRRLVIVGGVGSVSLALALAVSGFSLDEVLASIEFKHRLFDSGGDLQNTRISLLAFFSLLCVLLMLAGAVVLIRERRFDLWALIVAGVLPTLLLYAGGVDTPRYLVYLLSFTALLVARGLSVSWPVRSRSGYAWVFLLLAVFVGQYLLSYEIRPLDAPRHWAVLAALPVVEGDTDRVRLVLPPPLLGRPPLIGAGNNGGRLGAGIMLSPFWHAGMKRKKAVREAELRRVLEPTSEKQRRIISMGWGESQIVVQELLRQGLRLVEYDSDSEGRWERYEFASDATAVSFTQYRYPIIRMARQLGIASAIDKPDPGTILITRQIDASTMSVDADGGWDQLAPGLYVSVL